MFADSIDFLEDTSINLLILMAIGWSAVARRRTGKMLAAVILVPSLAAVAATIAKLGSPIAPAAAPPTLVGGGALVVNLVCALRLAQHRHQSGSMAKAAFLSARNDVFANVAIILAGLVTAMWTSIYPDLLVGIGIAVMNADAAKEIWRAASAEEPTRPVAEP